MNLKSLRSGLLGVLTDQALVSLGNFALNVTLARRFAERDYGIFSLIFSSILLLNTLHQAFVGFPLSVRGARAEHKSFSYLLAIAATLTFVEALLFLPVMGGVVISAGSPHLFLSACFFLLSWQLQEVYRRGLLARSRYGAAIINDFARYILPLGAIFALGLATPLSLQWIFLGLSLASLCAGWPLLSIFLQQSRAVFRNLNSELQKHWRMAAPVLFANLLAALSNQWFLWLLAWGQSLASAGALVALTNIVAFSQPVIFGMENILVPEIARRRDQLPFDRLLTLLKRRGFACIALTAPFFLIILVWPVHLLHLVYGEHKSYPQFAFALRLMTFTYMTYFVAFACGAMLRGYHAAGAVFKMQLYPALMAVTLGSWLVLRYGVTGACLAMFLAGLLRAGLGCYFVNRLRELTVPTRDEIVLT